MKSAEEYTKLEELLFDVLNVVLAKNAALKKSLQDAQSVIKTLIQECKKAKK